MPVFGLLVFVEGTQEVLLSAVLCVLAQYEVTLAECDVVEGLFVCQHDCLQLDKK